MSVARLTPLICCSTSVTKAVTAAESGCEAYRATMRLFRAKASLLGEVGRWAGDAEGGI
jgi:hypothetical protein